MSRLAVWTFDTSYGAERAGHRLRDLRRHERETILDAAWVSWRRGSDKPTIRVIPGLAPDEGLGETFWGVLFGLIFFSPLIGAAVGSAAGASSGSLAGFGIHETFVHRVRDAVAPGGSALFVLCSDTIADEVDDALRPDQPVKLLVTRLSRLQEGGLRQVFTG